MANPIIGTALHLMTLPMTLLMNTGNLCAITDELDTLDVTTNVTGTLCLEINKACWMILPMASEIFVSLQMN